ncbi:hypothetical protein [Streptomyces sp. MspMP-M5]|uniref:hypothetical protein n=1 Tax=Streptomyces sp. MspMP-M5 TaxID=1155718 RepID=UPI0013F7C155|nr:hypothetical protein [Streptomyces sp. MspMP-M5]MYT27512.1 hypothetical protein [Streptomyces sp. SID8354]
MRPVIAPMSPAAWPQCGSSLRSYGAAKEFRGALSVMMKSRSPGMAALSIPVMSRCLPGDDIAQNSP